MIILTYYSILIYILLCMAVGSHASGRKASTMGTFFMSLLFTPLVGLVAVLGADRCTDPPSLAALKEGDLLAFQRRTIPAKYKYLESLYHLEAEQPAGGKATALRAQNIRYVKEKLAAIENNRKSGDEE